MQKIRLVFFIFVITSLSFSVISHAAQQGQLVAWGEDTFGETLVPVGNDYIAVAAGERHSAALKSDGSIITWGDNRWGLENVPSGQYTAIAAGEHSMAALRRDGSLVAWGRDYDNCLDVPAGNDFVALAFGTTHGLALRSDGSLAVWGGDSNYGLQNVPTENNFISIAAGGYHCLALRADGTVCAWGYNENGQTDVPSGNQFVSIAAGRTHSLAIHSDGTVQVFGEFLGEHDPWSGVIPAFSPGNEQLSVVSGGYSNSLGLLTDRSLIAWGQDFYGTLDVPQGRDFISISAGDFHSLAIVVPEPVTLLLLGLGGATLIRRRC